MVVQSFVTYRGALVVIEVELVLVPGLPQIHFLGMPDQHVRESAARIKCALKKQGYEFPKSQQVLVNLRPSSMKKTSRGVELAVAAAFLWETGQVPMPLPHSQFFVYGELDLHGNVYAPEDLQQTFQFDRQVQVLTGKSNGNYVSTLQRLSVVNLKSLSTPETQDTIQSIHAKRTGFQASMQIKQSFAELIQYFSLSPFHLMLAGPAGSGKSTLAQNLIHFLPPPLESDLREISEQNQKTMSWWPLIAPHPTITAKAFLGNERSRGEVFRAHRGILFLDELLEFKPEALEVLRAPLDGHELLVSRVDQRVQQRSDFKCIATTNLCPCGDWLPDQRKEFECVLPEKKCNQYRQKLSGPLLDRFEILFLTNNKQEQFISFEQILRLCESNRTRVLSHKIVLSEGIERQLVGVSARRRNAFWKLLPVIEKVHAETHSSAQVCKIAYDLTIGNFQKLQTQSQGYFLQASSLRNSTIQT